VTEPTAEKTGRRAYAAALAAGLGGGLLAVLGASRPWAEVDAAATGMPASMVAVSGGAALPWVAALALVVSASWLGVLATAGTARRAVGMLSLLAALAVVAGALTGDGAVRAAVTAAVEASPTSVRGSGAVLAEQAARTGWPLVTALGGVLAALAATVVVLRGHRWPSMGRRYAAPGPAPAPAPAPAPPDPADWWQALDDGRDPTRTSDAPQWDRPARPRTEDSS